MSEQENRNGASRRDNPEQWVAGGHEKFETPMAAPSGRMSDYQGGIRDAIAAKRDGAKIREPNAWTATNAPDFWCHMHGQAFTYGCPGCDDAIDDSVCAAEALRRTRWWKLSQWCPHWWKELEPTVRRCRMCRCLLFESATMNQLRRWLGA